MTDAGRQADALGLFLTGGPSNSNPDLSLGGVPSSTRLRGLGAIVADPTSIPAIRIDNVLPACGEGEATLQTNADGDLVFTPPGGTAGDPVAIAAGESKVVSGADTAKAIRVFREAGLAFPTGGLATLTLVNALTGVLSMSNVTDAQRQTGVTTYRAIMLEAQGLFGVLDIRLWLPPVVGLQSVYHIGEETPVAGSIQIIADEFTAPGGIGWVNPNTEVPFALTIPVLHPGDKMGIWIRKVFPPGNQSVEEDFQLAIRFKGA